MARSTSSRDSSQWGGSNDDRVVVNEQQPVDEMSEEIQSQQGDTDQAKRPSNDTVGFEREDCEIVGSDGEEDTGEVDETPPGEASSSEEDGRRNETSSDDEGSYEMGDQSDSTECVGDGMTSQQREAMYHAVKNGDIELLDDLLDLSKANIRMEWFGENLLMAAIRANQQDMAEFLLDNGVDPNFETNFVDIRNARKGNVDCYTIDCRQMAYDHSNFDLVNLIDEINGMLWPFVKLRGRVIRKKKPLAEKLREKLDSDNKVSEDDSERELMTRDIHSGASTQQQTESKVKKKVKIQAEPVMLPKRTSFADDKNKRELTQTKPHLLTMPMLKTPQEDRCINSMLPELNEVNQSYPRTYMYKYTRDFLARQKARERQKIDQEAYDAGQSRVGNKWRYPSKNYTNSGNIQHNASIQGLRIINRRDISPTRIQSPTRLLSPWREDDEVLLRNLKSRSGRLSYRTQKPVLSRKQALLPLLSEHTAPKKLHKIIYNDCRVSPQLPVVKWPLSESSPVANERTRQMDSSLEAATPSPRTTPSLPPRGRSGRSRTAVTTSKGDNKYPRAKTHVESIVSRKTVKWDFDIDPVVPPTLVRYTAPPARSLDELEDTFEYNVPMAASIAYT